MNNSSVPHTSHNTNLKEENKQNSKNWNSLTNNEDFLNDVINTIPDLIYCIDFNSGNIIYINKRAEDLFGFDTDYIYEKGITFLQELVHPDDRTNRKNALDNATDGAVVDSEIRLQLKDGSYHWFRMRDRVIKRKPDGVVWQAISSGIDITLQKDGNKVSLQLKALLDSTKTGIVILQPEKDGNDNVVDFRLIHSNQHINNFFGNTLAVNGLYLENFPSAKTDGNFDKYVDALATKQTINFDTLYSDLDGGNKWYNQTIVVLEDGNVAITFQDGTERKKAEAALKEQSDLVQGIAHATPDILFVLDLVTKNVIYTNKQVGKVLGYTNEQIAQLNHTIFDLVYEKDLPALARHLDEMQTAANGEVRDIEYRMRAADGTLRWFIDRNTVFKRNSDGKPIEKIGISQDITLRKAQEDKINKNLEILQQSEELAQIGSWEYDIATRKFTWSEGMYKLFNKDFSEPVTPSIYLQHVLEQDKPLAEKIVAAIQDTYKSFTEILRIQINNQIKTIKIKSGVYKDGKGNKTSMVGVDMDITASIQTEIQIKELNNNLQIKNRGLESANTDLKAFNTLAATNYRQTLQKLYTSMEYLVTHDARNLSNEGRANIRRAQSSIQKMKLMTEDIINLSKLHTLDTELASVNLNDVLKQVVLSLHDKITETKALVNYPEMPVIQGYAILITLLFHHLLDNAIKFRKQEVKLEINITNTKNVVNGIGYHVISVTDNGIGFEQDKTQEVFIMFNRHSDPSYKGSGIGLAVCKKIMDIHDGFIMADSIVNTRTIFNCYFPIMQFAK